VNIGAANGILQAQQLQSAKFFDARFFDGLDLAGSLHCLPSASEQSPTKRGMAIPKWEVLAKQRR
jgi:hypothetical protein